MPDVNKLTLAIAADKTPDMVLGLASYVPFDLFKPWGFIRYDTV